MTRRSDTPSSSIEHLLSSERTMVAESDATRERILSRARNAAAEIARTQRTSVPVWRRSRVWVMAAALVTLTTISFALLKAPSDSDSESRHRIQESTLPASPPPPAAPSRPAPSAEFVPSAELGEPRVLPRSDEATEQEPAAKSRPRPSETYALELALLDRARAAVAGGDFVTALVSIREHRQRFPNGRLVEEREALRVKALRGLGREDEARRAAADFRARFPRSVLLPKMTEAVDPPK